ncbi:ecto-ADP-ribosyltransferase 4-like isoform X2 [Hypomesus transpacificus]|nr:ecto-ADP-ribosyltransferase 4-like isoform X2 [Hypomesus transpacificus]XP_046900927.1 ecto-ADP-ribosyltransferase 4-like isoform X2 [Hypomesus transpacificus]
MSELTLVFFLVATLKVIESKNLDMAPNTVDDQYEKCRDEMFQVVKGGLLNRELNTSELSSDWQQETCKMVMPGGEEMHTKALAIYGHNKRFRVDFTKAVETLGGNANVYNKDFQFKSFHFLLMDSFQVLKPTKCQTLFHGSETVYTAGVGSEVRFGSFVSADEKLSSVVEESKTVFNITTCLAIDLYNSACQPSDVGSWLLSPAEVFQVKEVKNHSDDDYSYIEIVLGSLRNESNHDCQYNFPRPPATTTVPSSTPQWLTSKAFHLMALSLSAFLSIASYQD